MIEPHPEILSKHGKRECLVLPCEEFEAIGEEPERPGDLCALRAAKAEEAAVPTIRSY